MQPSPRLFFLQFSDSSHSQLLFDPHANFPYDIVLKTFKPNYAYTLDDSPCSRLASSIKRWIILWTRFPENRATLKLGNILNIQEKKMIHQTDIKSRCTIIAFEGYGDVVTRFKITRWWLIYLMHESILTSDAPIVTTTANYQNITKQ